MNEESRRLVVENLLGRRASFILGGLEVYGVLKGCTGDFFVLKDPEITENGDTFSTAGGVPTSLENTVLLPCDSVILIIAAPGVSRSETTKSLKRHHVAKEKAGA